MVCIYCSGKTKVSNSRSSARELSTWRRRRCLECGATVTSREHLDYSSAMSVKTKNGRLSPFLRDKLFLSLSNSLSHRKTAVTDASVLTDTVIHRLLMVQQRGLLTRDHIIYESGEVLQRFDKAAATHYVAHHS